MRAVLVLAVLAGAGCTLPTGGLDRARDAGAAMDAGGASDAGRSDSGSPDDGGLRDGGADGGGEDAGAVDSGAGCVPTGPDVCNGLDDDCDPGTADGSADPPVPCDGADADQCEEGMTGCAAGMSTCSDTTGTSSETCDGGDEDCDGSIDEGATCPCPRFAFGGSSYLLCGSDDYAGALRRCGESGYELATITSDAEQDFVYGECVSHGGGDHWLGANDIGSEGAFAWENGTPFTYTNWASDQPNDGIRPADEDCLMLRTSSMGSRRPGGWFDHSCTAGLRFVCEARP